jgi:DNA repair exonuclease SbcCD ATPase subunit
VIIKGIRALTRSLHKAIIRHDPFAQLEEERAKMENNKTMFQKAKGNISQLKHEMEVESENSKKEAEGGQTKFFSLQGKAEKIKKQMEDLIAAHGVSAKAEDEYVNLASEFQKTVAEAQRVSNKLTQAKNFVEKYAIRANIMKTLGHKLTMVETAMEIKISDFDASVEMLKKDYEFAQKSRQATDAAKSAMLFTKGWELDYALDVVTTTIASDIAMTAGNLRDIDSLTNQYALNSDELYANLNTLADNIKVGNDVIPSAKVYNNPEYKLTQDDRIKSGGFHDLF